MKKFFGILGGSVFVVILLVISAVAYYHYGTAKTDIYCIEDKERVTDAEARKSKYLIYTDKEVLENTDSVYYLKYTSSDIYNDLKIGECYTLKVYGWRVPFFSWYKNIVSLKEIEAQSESANQLELQTISPETGENIPLPVEDITEIPDEISQAIVPGSTVIITQSGALQ